MDLDCQIICENKVEHDKRNTLLDDQFGSFVQPALEKVEYKVPVKYFSSNYQIFLNECHWWMNDIFIKECHWWINDVLKKEDANMWNKLGVANDSHTLLYIVFAQNNNFSEQQPMGKVHVLWLRL